MSLTSCQSDVIIQSNKSSPVSDQSYVNPLFSTDDELLHSNGRKENFKSISITWNNLNVHSKPSSGLDRCFGISKEPVHIIKDVTGHLDAGNLLAIIGASGAGKTTLLNVLTGRNLKNVEVRGRVSLNGQPASVDKLTSCSSYVQQDDLFIGILTVREHLLFQAHLRSFKKLTENEANVIVDRILVDLGLAKVADMRINCENTGQQISGGERKRLAIASEILTDPAILFCDEPTSGIDSFMAQSVVSVLKSLASAKRTIICTIHQPSSEIFTMFDKILLLAEGRVAFMGKASNALSFFSSLGLECPSNYNPADFYIQQLAIIPGAEDQCRSKVNAISDTFESSEYNKLNQIKDFRENGYESAFLDTKSGSFSPTYRRGAWTQFKMVIWRAYLTNLREPMLTTARVVNVIFSALLVASVYWKQKYNQEGIMNINGAIFLMIANANFTSIFFVTNTFCLETPIFFREHNNGLYRVSVYFWAKMIAELPYFIILPPITMSISYWAIGLYDDTEAFLMANLVSILIVNAASGFGYFISSISTSVTMALELAPPLMMPLALFGGVFMNGRSIPSYIAWMKYLSWFYYGNEILTVNQWRKVHNITCDYGVSTTSLAPVGYFNDTELVPSQLVTGGQPGCIIDGAQVLYGAGFSEDYVNRDYYLLFFVFVFFRFLSFAALYVRAKWRR